MKRSKDIKLGLLAATAAALAGCGTVNQPHYDVRRQCVDTNQVVVDDRYCRQTSGGTSVGHVYPYRWYYYGGGSPGPYGSRAAGGSYSAPAASAASSGTVRGVFGGTAAGHGFGGGGGE